VGVGYFFFQFQFVHDCLWKIAVEDLDFFFALVRSRPVLKDNAGGSPRGAAELTAREGSFASYGASARSFVR
jgi:hypothetical protein